MRGVEVGTVGRLVGMHANWVAPKIARARREGWSDADLRHLPVMGQPELITLIFSALAWHRHHGPIKLFADSRTCEFLDERQLLGLYDEVRTDEIDAIDHQVYAPHLYFSLPKFVALGAVPAPVAMIDFDLFLRAPLPEVSADRFVFAHFETLDCEYYPPLADLPNPNAVDFPGWRDDIVACNTAIAAFGSQPHLDDFVALSLAYMRNNDVDAPLHPGVRAIFAEQRLCSYTAARHDVTLAPVTTSVWRTDESDWTEGAPEALFHHTWHRKMYFTRQSMRDRYCRQLTAELLRTFPEAERMLVRDAALRRFVDEIRAAA
jgi:hypothetical protein